ncbi:MAG: hypothetical protein WD768_12585 [Phycisphaeraceae bacterium]
MSQFNAPTYDIARTTGHCAFTGRVLEPGEAYISTLVEVDPNETPAKGDAAALLGFRRVDVSMDAWKEGHRPPKLFGHWKAIVPEPNQKRKLLVDDDVLMNLLRRLADAKEQNRIAFRFVLALILMRKKLLRYDGTAKKQAMVQTTNDDGSATLQEVEQEWWQMTPKLDVSKGMFGKWNEEEAIDVLDPHLDEQQIQQVGEQVSEILNAEL